MFEGDLFADPLTLPVLPSAVLTTSNRFGRFVFMVESACFQTRHA